MATVHIVPLADQVQHHVPGGLDGHDAGRGRWLAIEADPDQPDETCACGADTEHVPNPDGPDGWIVTHHALDQRELVERQASA